MAGTVRDRDRGALVWLYCGPLGGVSERGIKCFFPSKSLRELGEKGPP